ncbi:MAG: adenosine deaminase [Candidatus Levybacteria bacterium]|nr:adenosine deaminase [Candidatus Levybacteria bacterium]
MDHSFSKQHNSFPNFPLAELHAHIGTSINPFVYWQIAHEQGYKVPKKTYHEFVEFITLSPEKKMKLNEYLRKIYHPVLDKLSSGTFALEKAMYETMGGAYRNNIAHIEIRGNIMKHNNNGDHDLDHIIMAMLRGMERAFLEYPNLSGGYIFCLDREYTVEKNAIMIEKAIKYKSRGVVAIDFAGPANEEFKLEDYKQLIIKAKKAGLAITTHSGEVDDANDMWEAIEFIKPKRIGHGIKAAYDKELMKQLVKQDVVLEVCPMSNLMTQAVENEEELKFILRTFIENKVKFTINTDWPEMIADAHLWRQFAMLRDKKIMSEEELIQCNKIAFASTFAPKGGLDAYL